MVLIVVSSSDRCDATTIFLCNSLKTFLADINWDKIVLVYTKCDKEDVDEEYAKEFMEHLNLRAELGGKLT